MEGRHADHQHRLARRLLLGLSLLVPGAARGATLPGGVPMEVGRGFILKVSDETDGQTLQFDPSDPIFTASCLCPAPHGKGPLVPGSSSGPIGPRTI